jgi:glycosyltransferase involved in cell wall biosynthesis/SAM-dependent methyltransferase
MRVAFFSPLPPARSGIADYSAALIGALGPLAEVEPFSIESPAFDPARFDIALYQVGNNGFHAFAYEAALRHPGVVALHESNLHHLIADLTIRRGDWEGYVRECEYNGGAEARAFAERVRKLEAGPDYEGVRMTRRLLESARGVVVHSRFLRDEVRAAGYAGPVAVIPHGAWIPDADRNGYREKLGLDEATPLAGIFGFLKPYKRIAESLRAFSRLARIAPDVRMILAGEEHPDFPLGPLIRSLGLSTHVRVLGFTPPEDFVGFMAACDVAINLRYPTVGESSGTLLRALGLGKPALVSDIGSFQEFPDDVCLKVPVGAGEEDLIFEYLSLLVSRPDLAREIGARARDYVARECNWTAVAQRYAAFLKVVAAGESLPDFPSDVGQVGNLRPIVDRPVEVSEQAPPEPDDLAPYLRTWAPGGESRQYLESHETRLVRTLNMIPPGGPGDRILEMGAYLQITPALRSRLGYGDVRGCYYGAPGHTDLRAVTSSEGERFACEIDHFDAEKDVFPYPDGHFTTVLCCELIEHLAEDPMHMMCEINRILKPGGHLLLTTPNIAALRGIAAILQGYHPGFYHSYLRPARPDEEVAARHNREYTPREVHLLLANSGFEVARLETGEFRDRPHPEYRWVLNLLEKYRLDASLRGDGIHALGRKTGPVRERHPAWLYS